MIVELRPLKLEEYTDFLEAMKQAYPNWQGQLWSYRSIERLVNKFPEGQLAAIVDDKVVGCALSIVVDYSRFGDNHTYAEITANYTFDTHTEKGDVLYGLEIFVSPEFRGLRLGRRLYDARKELCEKLELRAIVFGGRMPNYFRYSEQFTPKQYIDKVKRKELFDPVLTFQLSNDFHVIKILKGYMPDDRQSRENAVLLEWNNIYYENEDQIHLKHKNEVRLGLVQWQMRPYRDLDDLFEQVEYFISSLATYKSDFALFPEFFNAPLMVDYNHLGEADAIRELARFTPEIRKRMQEYSVKYNINIITGSFPEIIDGRLHNVGYLCHRNGELDRYEKIHITPDESRYWGIMGGNKVETFDTDCARIGILICYDVEFPELGRILSDQGMQILMVPFLTDTQNAFYRVRHCAQSRAIENECFVAITGSVGNLPKVKNMDISYSQAAVLTPCDFQFPSNGIKGEATPNTEMVLIVDVDLSLLEELHHYGSVKNRKDRRLDLYNIEYKGT